MDKRNTRYVAIALLAVVAIAFSAATLNSVMITEEGGSGIGGRTGSGVGADTNDSTVEVDMNRTNATFNIGNFIDICYSILNNPFVVAGIFGFFGVGMTLFYRYRGGAIGAMAFVGAFGPPIYLLHLVFTSGCNNPEGDDTILTLPFFGNQTSFPGGGMSGLGGEGSAVSTPSAILTVVLGLAILVGLYFLIFVPARDQEEEPQTPPKGESKDAIRAAVGRAAGEAADRIEGNADVTNEVYRAWREMTRYLDVKEPEASTPGEFADAAVETGMRPDDVYELTRLFEEVRYGGESPTEERERRAVEALRRIESEYAEEGESGE